MNRHHLCYASALYDERCSTSSSDSTLPHPLSQNPCETGSSRKCKTWICEAVYVHLLFVGVILSFICASPLTHRDTCFVKRLMERCSREESEKYTNHVSLRFRESVCLIDSVSDVSKFLSSVKLSFVGVRISCHFDNVCRRHISSICSKNERIEHLTLMQTSFNLVSCTLSAKHIQQRSVTPLLNYVYPWSINVLNSSYTSSLRQSHAPYQTCRSRSLVTARTVCNRNSFPWSECQGHTACARKELLISSITLLVVIAVSAESPVCSTHIDPSCPFSWLHHNKLSRPLRWLICLFSMFTLFTIVKFGSLCPLSVSCHCDCAFCDSSRSASIYERISVSWFLLLCPSEKSFITWKHVNSIPSKSPPADIVEFWPLCAPRRKEVTAHAGHAVCCG